MDRGNMERAAKLLAKAQSTNSDGEAIALVEKAYQLLAAVITAAEDAGGSAAGGPHRRERRYRRDRRAGRRGSSVGVASPGTDSVVTYRRLADDLRPREKSSIDLIG